jgi:protein-S-isoprenylcysteine O-methyltransferase Ste14
MAARMAKAVLVVNERERDLIAGLGDTRRTYRAEVPAVIPRPLVP